MKRFNDTSNNYLVLVRTLTTNLTPQNGNEYWGTDPTCMHSCGFSVTEENTWLMLCIATGKNVQNLWTRSVRKLKTIFYTTFTNINKNSLQNISESATVSPCFCHRGHCHQLNIISASNTGYRDTKLYFK